MKCPYCNEEMELGYLQSYRRVFWNAKRQKPLFVPIIAKKDDIDIPTDFWGSYVETYLCRKCNVMISPLKR